MPDQFLSNLLSKQRVFITTHARPDGDAIGSQLALGLFLEKLGKQVEMINSDPVPVNLSWMPGVEKILVFDKSLDHLQRINDADAVVIVDANALHRVGDLAKPVENTLAPKFLIDHHTEPEEWFTHMYERDTASSTGELIYELIVHYDADFIDTPIATALYTAIMTDTGSFRFSAVVPALHRSVADILERGHISPAPIHDAVYDTRSVQSLRLLSKVLSTITLRYDGQVGYMTITSQMLRDLGADSDETNGFVNYVLSVDTVKAGLLFLETAKGTKVSFRSTGDTHVNGWARAFGGGGHRNASGAFVKHALDKTIQEVMDAAPRFIQLAEDGAGDGDEVSAEDASYLASLLDMKENKS